MLRLQSEASLRAADIFLPLCPLQSFEHNRDLIGWDSALSLSCQQAGLLLTMFGLHPGLCVVIRRHIHLLLGGQEHIMLRERERERGHGAELVGFAWCNLVRASGHLGDGVPGLLEAAVVHGSVQDASLDFLVF